jgi:hypothetical protein
MRIKSNSIVVRLEGGLGNQLFGWAAGFQLARRLNLKLELDASLLIQRKLGLDSFNLSRDINILTNSPKKRKDPIRSLPLFREKNFRFDTRICEIDEPVVISGYFQSWRYFVESESEIRRLITLRDESTQLKSLRERLSFQEVLGIHVRRGDYIGLENHHGITHSEYFRQSIVLADKLTSFSKIAVFSDDISAAKETIPDADYYISDKEISSPAENLILMSECVALIGSNSSFSWWAGFVSDGVEKVRIFPRPWFTGEDLDTRDLLPKHWITLGL